MVRPGDSFAGSHKLAGVKPGKSTFKRFCAQLPLLQMDVIQVGDFELTTGVQS